MIFRERVAPVELPGPLRALGAVAAGCAVGAGFAPISLAPLLLFGLAGFTLLIAGRSLRGAAGLGYLFGLGCCTVSVSWLHGLGVWIAALLVVWMALYFLAYALVARLALRLPGWPVWIAAAWGLMEFTYSRWPFGGFGWIRLGFASVDTPLAPLLRLIGVAGVGLVLALSAQLLAWLVAAVLERRHVARRFAATLVAMMLVLGPAVVAQRLGAPYRPGAGKISIGVVQGNVDGVNALEPFGRARSVTNNHLSETVTLLARARTSAAPPPDFVLWPENSTDIDPTRDPETAAVIQTASEIAGVPILVGSVTDGPGDDERQTGGLWWSTDGRITQRYFKRNLVPFGEYIPMRAFLLPRIPILKLTGAQSIPGTTPGIFHAPTRGGEAVVGDVICFELAYDATVYETVRSGAQVLVVQSNNASYGGTPQVPQQWQITRARAIETGRDIAVATTDSYSGFIRSDGSVEWRSQEFTSASRTATLTLRDDRTPALTLAPVVDVAAAGVGGLVLVAGIVAAVASRRGRSS